MLIAGPHDLSPYFENVIKPKLSDRIQYIGEVDNTDKWDLMKNAKAVIFTSTCEEGDPNVPKEALFMGTPVIALDGTVSEIVEDGDTGLICKSVDEMVDRGISANYIEPEVCRQRVLEKFGREKYIESTLKLLQKAIKEEEWI